MTAYCISYSVRVVKIEDVPLKNTTKLLIILHNIKFTAKQNIH